MTEVVADAPAGILDGRFRQRRIRGLQLAVFGFTVIEFGVIEFGEKRLLQHIAETGKPNAHKPNRADIARVDQQTPRHGDQRASIGGRVGQRRRAGHRRHIGLLQLDRDRPGSTPVALQPAVGMLGDRSRGLLQLPQRGHIGVECGLGADLFSLGPFHHRPVVDAPGQLSQRRPDGAAQNAAHLRVG